MSLINKLQYQWDARGDVADAADADLDQWGGMSFEDIPETEGATQYEPEPMPAEIPGPPHEDTVLILMLIWGFVMLALLGYLIARGLMA